jgi:hypothetical protein
MPPGEVVYNIGELMDAGQVVGTVVCGVGADFQDRLGDEVHGDTALGLSTPTALPPAPHESRLAIKSATPANRSAADAIHQFVWLPCVTSSDESHAETRGRSELMKLCCVQLFNAGLPSDVLLIWRAKESSWDMHCSVDVQLLCGAGLEETKAFLAAEGSDDSVAALRYLLDCEAAGDFQDFSIARHTEFYTNYYHLS